MNYRIIGHEKIDIIIEMGFGSCIEEWLPFIEKLKINHTILIYERFGINNSKVSDTRRTPNNISDELYDLINTISHQDKLTIIAHSGGAIYSILFAKKHPNLINKLILLDPLSINDNMFKKLLTKEEYKKSGVDKLKSYELMLKLSKMKLGFISKKIMKSAPPFYYYNFNDSIKKKILNSYDNINNLKTIINEYNEAHNEENLYNIEENYPDVEIILITHSSSLAIQENIKFGNNNK